jgi:hypothetical protein
MIHAPARRLLAALALCAALFPASAAADAPPPERPNPYMSDSIETLVHGVYCAEGPVELEEAPGTAAGVVNIVPGLPEMRAVTTLVPARIGVGFGLLVTPVPGAVPDPVDITITHPPYPDSGIEVERWSTVLEGGQPGLVGFSFELESELVPGPWHIAGRHRGELLFDVRFEVVPAAALPDLAQGCAGAVLS